MSESSQQITRSYSREAEVLRVSLARASGGDRHLAEDIAQESWLRAVLYWPANGVPDKPGAWLRTVSRNILFNEGRRKRFVRLDDVAPGVLRVSHSEGVFDSKEQHAMLGVALGELPPEDRDLVESHYFAGRPLADIAQGLGLSDRAVEGRLRRVRIRLRAVLESRGLTGAELRGVTPTPGLSLGTAGKSLLLAPVLPFLAILVGYFFARRLASKLSMQGRAVAQVFGGIGLVVLGTLESPDFRALQLFGVGTLLYGAWRVWKRVGAQASV